MARTRSTHADIAHWRAQEQLLLAAVMKLVGRSLAPEVVLREMLHLMSELLGLNRGRIVLADVTPDTDATDASALLQRALTTRRGQPCAARIVWAYGLTAAERARGHYAPGEGVTGRVLATGQPALVQDIDAEPGFLFRSVTRERLPPECVAFIALPIELHVRGSARVVGVLACHRIRSRTRQLDDDLALMRILATLTGQVLQLHALVAERTQALEARNEQLTRALEAAAARYGLVGSSPALLKAIDALERVSDAQASVLLLGESGSGKELFARALHLASPRRDAPFIKVNCAAIPETLFESELFGHERGAFTGAVGARAGWFEQAHGGTIFLDEIGELPLGLQAKLLRTLQEGTLTRLGGQREIRVDIRLVAATHRSLADEVAAGRFRRDLYYRLNVIPIQLPSLRERRDDVHLLALHFLNRANQAHQRNVHLAPDALARLQAHDWPGNIRELGNVIERVVLLSETPLVDAAALGRFLAEGGSTDELVAPPPPTRGIDLPLVREYLPADSHPAAQLREALARAGGNQSRAAQALGLTARQFAYRWRKLHEAPAVGVTA